MTSPVRIPLLVGCTIIFLAGVLHGGAALANYGGMDGTDGMGGAYDGAGASPQADYGQQGASVHTVPVVDKEEAMDPVYWGKKRGVSIIQMISNSKQGKFEAGLFGGVIPNDTFLSYGTVGVRAGYYFSEAFSIEASYTKPFSNESDLEERLRARYPEKIYNVQINDVITHMTGVNLGWTPISGKTAIFSKGLSTFDLGVSMGVGWMFAQYRNVEDGKVVSRETPVFGAVDLPGTPIANLGVGFRFFILDWLAVRADVNQYFFAKSMGGLSHPTMVSLGATSLFSLGGK